jgi:transcriptional/translational regulatory protein YebC/TACO1
MHPRSLVSLDDKTARQALRLLDRLEELDDVQKVFTNADFPAEALERYQAAA